mgnify:CR=1 FL=1|jgi:hypothetical protein
MLRIGLYGGIANNMYIFSKSLINHKIDTIFIRDRTDRYPFSQPVWEDCKFTLNYGDLEKASRWSWDKWNQKENELNWKQPSYIFDPLIKNINNSVRLSNNNLYNIIFNYLLKKNRLWNPIINKIRECDLVIVCGIEGAIIASISNIPYIIWPHGGDIRTASGFHRPAGNIKNYIRHYFFSYLPLKKAYNNALFIGSHDPTGVGCTVGRTIDSFPNTKFLKLPIPLKSESRLKREKRRMLLNKIISDIDISIPEAKIIGFIPSRIDFYWKGHDILFESLNSLSNQKDIHLIASGWGKDYLTAKNMLINNSVTFLPCALSKQIVYNLYKASDFVIDQFVMGTYGTSAVEAMSFGAPVLMWINNTFFQNLNWEPPPVINAKTKEEVLDKLNKIISGEVDLEIEGQRCLDWVNRIHDEKKVISNLFSDLDSILN